MGSSNIEMQNVSQYVHNFVVLHLLFIISIMLYTRITLGHTAYQTFQLQLWLQLLVVVLGCDFFLQQRFVCMDIIYFCLLTIHWNLSITDILGPNVFACNTEVSILRGKCIKVDCWDQFFVLSSEVSLILKEVPEFTKLII